MTQRDMSNRKAGAILVIGLGLIAAMGWSMPVMVAWLKSWEMSTSELELLLIWIALGINVVGASILGFLRPRRS